MPSGSLTSQRWCTQGSVFSSLYLSFWTSCEFKKKQKQKTYYECVHVDKCDMRISGHVRSVVDLRLCIFGAVAAVVRVEML
jgi:hypothetical protein